VTCPEPSHPGVGHLSSWECAWICERSARGHPERLQRKEDSLLFQRVAKTLWRPRAACSGKTQEIVKNFEKFIIMLRCLIKMRNAVIFMAFVTRTHTSETSNHRFSNTSHAIYATLPRCREYSHNLRLFYKRQSISQKLDLDEYPNISFAETIEIIYVSHEWHNTSPKLKYYYLLINRR